ncbi:MAG TPA: UdgX family uracil-DNA binding protein [Sphingomonadaceae bacterium]|nr:UdgX family uracil-DNA binding protein [Sphingomonadaceae bacterium]
MHLARLAHEADFDGWRAAARALALGAIPPERVAWQVGDRARTLFGSEPVPPAPAQATFSVPRPFLDLAEAAIQHSDAERFALLYTLLLRLRAQPRALEDRANPLLNRVQLMAKDVRRDAHKMHAFVRFREVRDEDAARYVAWFEPDHYIVRAQAGFFTRRFANMDWTILTPEVSMHWNGEEIAFLPGATKADAPDGDPVEETWKTYYASIFNPARVKVKAMTKEMPRKYWKNMPETALVGQLIAGAQGREAAMVERSREQVAAIPERGSDLEIAQAGLFAAGTAERTLQPGGNRLASWEALLAEAKACTRCHLYGPATQTVFGEGPLDAPLMFVGEQPGDQEDLAGRPFVGPAGQLFNQALGEAGVDRSKAYVTNAVKHFKYEARGKRRIHAKPEGPEIEACRWWIDRERDLLRPAVTVALGATAARSLFGKVMTIGKSRGAPMTLADGGEAWITVHPSFLLRIPEPDRKAEEYARFVADLRRIAERVAALAS